MGDNLRLLKYEKENNKDKCISINKHSQLSYLNLITLFICHRIPERTFNIKGYYFPLCSRCTGLYLGVLLCLIYMNQFYVYYTTYLLLISFLMIIPTVIDGITQSLGYHESNNIVRFLTGIIAGIGLVIFVKIINSIIIMILN